jgi:hypothetical protein
MWMPHLVRSAGALLLLGLAGWSYVGGELQFAAAGVAVAALMEMGLVLRARRDRSTVVRDRSRVSAMQVSCTEQDGVLKVALVGKAQGRSKAPYVLLSRPLLGAPGAELRDERPCLELGDPKWSVHGGIREACLTPKELRLELRTAAAEALGVEEVRVMLPTGQDQRQLERALRRVLRGVAFTSERSMPEEEAQEAPAGAA